MNHRRLFLLAGLTAAAFFFRVVNFAQQPFLGWDDAIFAVVGKHLLLTGRLDYTWGRPLHVIFLALAYGFFGLRASTGALVAVFGGTLTVPLVYQLGKQVFGDRAGLAAALLLTGSYFHVWWSRWTQSQAVMILFLTLATLAYARSLSADGSAPWRWCLAGFFLGCAYTLHYSVFMLVPVWAAFEIYAGFRFKWPARLRLKRAIGLAVGLAAIPGLFGLMLMPPESPLWYKLAGWYNWRALALGCCYVDEVRRPFYEDGLGLGSPGDWSYYFRVVLAFEGFVGLAALFAGWAQASRRAVTGWTAGQQWIALHGMGGFAILIAASTAGGDARAKIVALVLVTNILLASDAVGALAGAVRRRWSTGLSPMLPTVAIVIALSLFHVWPLMTISTPYAAVFRQLRERGDRPVVVLFSGSHVKPHVWRFYLEEASLSAENAQDLQARCVESQPALLLKSSDTALPGNASALPLEHSFVDATTILVAAHYEETHNRTYYGTPLLPEPPGSIQIYDFRDCMVQLGATGHDGGSPRGQG